MNDELRDTNHESRTKNTEPISYETMWGEGEKASDCLVVEDNLCAIKRVNCDYWVNKECLTDNQCVLESAVRCYD